MFSYGTRSTSPIIGQSIIGQSIVGQRKSEKFQITSKFQIAKGKKTNKKTNKRKNKKEKDKLKTSKNKGEIKSILTMSEIDNHSVIVLYPAVVIDFSGAVLFE